MLSVHSEVIICTGSETVLAHSNTMYLIVLCLPVPQFCAQCTIHMQGVKRHQISVRQSS